MQNELSVARRCHRNKLKATKCGSFMGVRDMIVTKVLH